MTTLRLPTRKLGDDIPLEFALTAATGIAETLVSAHVTITRIDTGAITVSSVEATLVSSTVARYWWSPTLPGEYVIEWHAVYGAGINHFSKDRHITIDPRRSTSAVLASSGALDFSDPDNSAHLQTTGSQ